MSKKCAKCRVPIEGFWSFIPKIFGVKKSIKDPELCNKCDGSEPLPAVKDEKNIAEPPKVDLMTPPSDEVMKKPEDDLIEKK